MLARWILASVAVAISLPSSTLFGQPGSQDDGDQRVVSDLLLARRWPNGVIPYTFDPVFAATANLPEIRDALDGWASENAVRFEECTLTGSSCDSHLYYAYFILDPAGDHTNNKRGYADLETAATKPDCVPASSTSSCRLKPCAFLAGQPCVFDVWLRGDTRNYMWNAGHEFGHMLGFNHEQSRPDRHHFIDTSECPSDAGVLSNEHFIGAYDVESIMHYTERNECYASLPGAPIGRWRNDNVPTRADLDKLKRLYGVNGHWLSGPADTWCIVGEEKIHVGNFDGEAGSDLLCHSRAGGVGGGRELAYANAADAFAEDGSVDWQASDIYCRGGGREVYVGDYNGDGKDDLLCHNAASGTKSIDWANDSGQLNGANWSGGNRFCWGAGRRLYVGDFNGDSRDDLLCHNGDTGTRSVDYAEPGVDGSGLLGRDWDHSDSEDADDAWCFGLGRQILIGDFDGDGRDDLLCHTRESGRRRIDYASDSGRFRGTNWDSGGNPGGRKFCSGARNVLVGDVNGDGSDDVLCHNPKIGSVSIDHATSNDRSKGSGLWGKNWYREISFCNAQDGRLLLGDFDAEGRIDLLCHNTATGHKAIRYANQFGTY